MSDDRSNPQSLANPVHDEDDEDLPATLARPRKPRKGLYILPNLFTLGCLFGGFYAIVMAMQGQFELAATAIFIAMVMDSLDGRVARLTGTTSDFGVQMDSLADMVSFGAAPALIMYTWALNDLGRVGWLIAFLYCACAALRLARFNTNVGVVDKRFFQGLPSPAAAALVMGFVWLMHDLEFPGKTLSYAAAAFTAYAGVTMVTNVPFYSFKDVPFKKSVPFIAIVGIAFGIALITLYPPAVLFALFICYGLSGYVVYGWRRRRGEHASVISTSTDEPDEQGLHR